MGHAFFKQPNWMGFNICFYFILFIHSPISFKSETNLKTFTAVGATNGSSSTQLSQLSGSFHAEYPHPDLYSFKGVFFSLLFLSFFFLKIIVKLIFQTGRMEIDGQESVSISEKNFILQVFSFLLFHFDIIVKYILIMNK